MSRNKRWLSFVLVALLVGVAGVAAAQSEKDDQAKTEQSGEAKLPEVDEVMSELDDLYKSSASHGKMRMTVVKNTGTRELEIEQWTKGDELALMVIRKPARESGTATLMNDDGLWNYAPRADRLIRIPSGLLSDSWMGSHFSNDDLMRESNLDEDYTTEMDWTTEDGTRYLRATLTPRPKAPVPYSKVVYLLTADEWLPVRARYYDDEEVVRTMKFTEVREADGRKFPHKMTLTPADEPDERTVVEFVDMDFDADVDRGLFSKRGLRKVARTR